MLDLEATISQLQEISTQLEGIRSEAERDNTPERIGIQLTSTTRELVTARYQVISLLSEVYVTLMGPDWHLDPIRVRANGRRYEVESARIQEGVVVGFLVGHSTMVDLRDIARDDGFFQPFARCLYHRLGGDLKIPLRLRSEKRGLEELWEMVRPRLEQIDTSLRVVV